LAFDFVLACAAVWPPVVTTGAAAAAEKAGKAPARRTRAK
jgi:hypothetical protein